MNKYIKIILIIVGVIIAIILLDTLQARIFKSSPIISYKVTLEDKNSWVDKGILMDTYYCTKDSDIITVSWHFKTNKYICPIDNEEIIIKEELNMEDVTMSIKEGTLTNTGAIIIITDNSGLDNTYGEYYRIERYINNNWQELDVIVEGNYGFNSIGYKVGENNTLELTINWELLYGKLETGDYRLIKEIDNKYFSVLFTITSPENNDNNGEVIEQPIIDNSNSLIEDNDNLVIKTITDSTNLNTSCAQAIDVFYEDTNYKYYYTCIKSHNIIVSYTNGIEETIKVALNNGHIKITDLDKYKIHYLREKKVTVTR